MNLKKNKLNLLLILGLLSGNALAQCIDGHGEPIEYAHDQFECEHHFQGTWVTKTAINIPIVPDLYAPWMIEFNNQLYYNGIDTAHGTELWVTDGSVAGTLLVKDIQAGTGSSRPNNYFKFNNKLYFSTFNDFYETDGTGVGTILVENISPNLQPVTYNNKFYFPDYVDNTYGTELYSSDGTSNGTSLVKDIDRANYGSFPADLVVFKNKLFFRAAHETYGNELFVSDGTAAGTGLLKDIYIGDNNGGFPRYMTVFNDQLFFYANDGTNGGELWRSDGTAAGTHLFKDIKTGGRYDSSSPSSLTVSNNKLFFIADNGTNGKELWISDGTVEGTVMLKDINPGPSSSKLAYLTAFNNKLYFNAQDADGYGLWQSDGTEVGTFKIVSLNDGLKNIYAGTNTLYFVTSEGHIYQTDGTEEGIRNLYREEITTVSSTPFTHITFSQEQAKDISVTLSLSDPTKGSLSATTITSTDMASAQTALHAVTYVTNGGDYTETVTITVDDGTNTTSYAHNLVVSVHVNPTSQNMNIALAEDVSKTFSVNDFEFSPAQQGDTFHAVIISSLPSKGNITLNNSNVVVNQSVNVDDLASLVYTPAENESGSPYTTFGFKVSDGSQLSVEYTATINVSAVDDAPEINIATSHNYIANNNSYAILLNSTDAEGDSIGYTAASLDTTKASVEIVNGELVVTPLNGAEGSVTVVVNAVANGQVSSQQITIDLTTPAKTSLDNLVANKWNMIALPKGKVLDSTELTASEITAGKAVKVYRNGEWQDSPTDINAKEAIWLHPTSTSLDLTSATADTTHDFADKAAQFAYYKGLSSNEWHFVGVQYTMTWGELTKAVLTPDACQGYTFIKYYDSANDSWNTSSNIPAGAGIWLRHLCD
ncbi:ELWxxDGT repeat protein [Catenovulum sediminis]|uniref:ELWxxDGT repeat protein n=1 Tax=Catenovulum sediminis TaxID=1740262 RepID=A0ABV1RF04_9ALTE